MTLVITIAGFTALALLAPVRQQVETKDWADERLKVLVLQAVAHHAQEAAT